MSGGGVGARGRGALPGGGWWGEVGARADEMGAAKCGPRLVQQLHERALDLAVRGRALAKAAPANRVNLILRRDGTTGEEL